MWKCKKCGCDEFYQTFKGTFFILKADKNQNIIEANDSVDEYSKFYCMKCNNSGSTLDKVADWEEEDERD